MARFLLGVVTGVALVIVGLVVLFLAAVFMQSRPPEVAGNSVLVMRLRGDIPEKPPVELPALLGGAGPGATVADVWLSLRNAAADPRIKAILLEPEGLTSGWAKLEEIRADLDAFRKSGKPVYAFLRQPQTRDYYVALAADRIYLGPQEPLMLKGLRAETLYFKDTLAKLGVGVEVEHAGKYKDFGDMFTRSEMSPETREVLSSMVDGLYANLVARIAAARRKTQEDVRAAIDRGPFTAKRAVEAGLVDELRFEDEVWSALRAKVNAGELKKIALASYARADTPAALRGRSRIAFVAAQGDIVRGNPGDDGSGEAALTSYGFVKVLRGVAADSGVKGVIVRIDSPGGEVTASDEIWREMNLLGKKKPMVISMSDAAASGGYYMAMTGDPIVASAGTMTGSIGVVFGKPNLRGLYGKLGISKDAVERGKNAGIDSDYAPLTAEQRELLREGVEESYGDFLSKVAAARRRTVAEIEPVAQGRVWLGSQAASNGLVDQIGGIDTALELVKKKAGIPAAEHVKVDLYPARVSLLDVLLKRPSPESLLESRLAKSLGRMPYRAWMNGGFLRIMPYAIDVR